MNLKKKIKIINKSNVVCFSHGAEKAFTRDLRYLLNYSDNFLNNAIIRSPSDFYIFEHSTADITLAHKICYESKAPVFCFDFSCDSIEHIIPNRLKFHFHDKMLLLHNEDDLNDHKSHFVFCYYKMNK